jgi:tetratricopeptide (TPR) repeat protein
MSEQAGHGFPKYQNPFVCRWRLIPLSANHHQRMKIDGVSSNLLRGKTMKRIVRCGMVAAILCWTVLESAADKIHQKGSTAVLEGTIIESKDATIKVAMGAAGETAVPRERIERVEIAQPASLKEGLDALRAGNWPQVVKTFEPLYVKYRGLPQDWLEEMTIRLGQAYAGTKDWSKTLELSLTFRKYYPESQFVDLASSLETQALVGSNKLGEAKGKLEILTKKIEDEAAKTREGAVTEEQDRALGPAYVVLGKCYEAANENDKALEAYLKTTTLYYRDTAAVAEALYQSALLFEKMKNPTRARDQLEELVKDYSNSSFAPEAKKKLDSSRPTTPK